MKKVFNKYPFIKQRSLSDCGVACLLMILNYHHGNIDYEYIRDLTNTDTKGTTAYHLIEGAKKLGFKAYGIKCELDNINQMILPAIAHLKLETGYHYVVIYKINKKDETIIVADPVDKIKKYSFLDFSDLWTGVMIILYPNSSIKYINDDTNICKLIMPTIKKYYHLVLKICMLSIILGSTYFITSFYTEWLMNDITSNSQIYLIILSLFMFLCYMIKNITNFIRNNLLAFLTRRMQLIMTNDIVKRIIYLPFNFYDRRTTGEVISKITDFMTLQNFIQKVFIYISFDLILLIISLIVLLSMYNQLFYIQLLFLIANIMIMISLNNYYINYNANLQKNKDVFINYLTEIVMGYESIKGIGVEENINDTFLSKYHLMIKDEESYQKLLFTHNLSKDLLQDILYITQMLVISFLIMKNDFQLTSFFTYQLFSSYFLEYSTNGIYIFRDYKNIKEVYKRISFLFAKQEEEINNDLVFNKITFTNFTCGYNSNLFNPFSLNINLGSKILLKGESGSGKSTIFKNLMKYYEIDRGLIYFNDIDINDCSHNDIKHNITYVTQNGLLFTNSLYYNLTLNRNIDRKELENIIKLCHIDEIMFKHNLGLNMWLNENGQNLSGGERQRIILGRALLNNFQILLLDEATNQMDASLEENILNNIFRLYKDKIIIVISHHKKLLAKYDYILEIKNNEVIINEY